MGCREASSKSYIAFHDLNLPLFSLRLKAHSFLEKDSMFVILDKIEEATNMRFPAEGLLSLANM